MKRRLLQIFNVILAFLTIVLAMQSIVFGVNNPFYDFEAFVKAPALDSNLRFLGGLGLGIGLILLWITPTIEKHTILFRSIWIIAFLGGIGRIISMFVFGFPPLPMIIFTFIEVPIVPILIFWQWRITQESSR